MNRKREPLGPCSWCTNWPKLEYCNLNPCLTSLATNSYIQLRLECCPSFNIEQEIRFAINTGSTDSLLLLVDAWQMHVDCNKLKNSRKWLCLIWSLVRSHLRYSWLHCDLQTQTANGTFGLPVPSICVAQRPENEDEKIVMFHYPSTLGMDILPWFKISFRNNQVLLEPV